MWLLNVFKQKEPISKENEEFSTKFNDDLENFRSQPDHLNSSSNCFTVAAPSINSSHENSLDGDPFQSLTKAIDGEFAALKLSSKTKESAQVVSVDQLEENSSNHAKANKNAQKSESALMDIGTDDWEWKINTSSFKISQPEPCLASPPPPPPPPPPFYNCDYVTQLMDSNLSLSKVQTMFNKNNDTEGEEGCKAARKRRFKKKPTHYHHHHENAANDDAITPPQNHNQPRMPPQMLHHTVRDAIASSTPPPKKTFYCNLCKKKDLAEFRVCKKCGKSFCPACFNTTNPQHFFAANPGIARDWCALCAIFAPIGSRNPTRSVVRPNLTRENLKQLTMRQLVLYAQRERIELCNEDDRLMTQHLQEATSPTARVTQLPEQNRRPLQQNKNALIERIFVFYNPPIAALPAPPLPAASPSPSSSLLCNQKIDDEESRMTQPAGGGGGKLCCVCRSTAADCMALNCRHVFGCHACTENMKRCAVCRQDILYCVQFYRG